MFSSRILAAVAVCVAVGASPVSAQEPFYKGKRLTLLVNFDAGSATDIDARVFARHFIKHVDGAPQLIIQNMPGGGGANGTMYLGEVAPKDGTVVGFLTATAWNFAAEPERFRVDFKTYEHIGYTGGTAVYYMRKDVPPGINKPTDIVKAKGLVSGGVNARTGRDISIRLTLDILGVPFRHVTGYGSGERARLALQRQEIHLYADTTPGYRGAVEGTLVKDGTVIPLWYDPHWDGKTFSKSKQVEGLADQGLSRGLSGDLRQDAVRPAVGGLSRADHVERRDAAHPVAAAGRAAGCGRRVARGARCASTTTRNTTPTRSRRSASSRNTTPAPTPRSQVRNALTVRPEIRTFVADYIAKGAQMTRRRRSRDGRLSAMHAALLAVACMVRRVARRRRRSRTTKASGSRSWSTTPPAARPTSRAGCSRAISPGISRAIPMSSCRTWTAPAA